MPQEVNMAKQIEKLTAAEKEALKEYYFMPKDDLKVFVSYPGMVLLATENSNKIYSVERSVYDGTCFLKLLNCRLGTGKSAECQTKTRKV